MSDEFSSYFSLGFVISIILFFVIVLRNKYLFKYSIKNILEHKKVSLTILASALIAPILIATSLIVNDSIVRSSSNYTISKVGETTGIIYSVNDQSWNVAKVNEIYSKVNTEFSNFLPVYSNNFDLEYKNNSHAEVSALYFDKNIASTYSRDIFSIVEELSLKENEVIISQSIANELKIESGEKIKIKETSSEDLIVKKILPDNGLIGFENPHISPLKPSFGSIYLSKEILFGKNEPKYNTVFLKRNIKYNPDSLEVYIRSELNKYDPNLAFQEVRESTRAKSMGGNTSINFGQILLLTNLFGIISGVVLTFSIFYRNYKKRKKELELFEYFGLTKSSLTRVMAFEGFIYSIIASVSGVVISIFFSKIVFEKIKDIIIFSIPTTELKPSFELILDFNSLTYAFIGAFFVLFFSFILFGTIISTSLLRRKTYKELTTNQVVLLIIFGLFSITTLYFANTGKFNNPSLSTFANYFGINILVITLGYALRFIFNEKKVTTFSALIISATNLLVLYFEPFKSLWKDYPYLLIVNSILFVLSVIFVIFYNINFITKIFIPYRIRRTKFGMIVNLGLRKISDNKFIMITVTSIFSILITFLFITTIAKTQVSKLVRDLDTNFDVIVTDQSDTTNVESILAKKDYIANIVVVRFSNVTLDDYRYGDIKNFTEDNVYEYQKDEKYISTLSTADESFFDENIKFKDQISEKLQENFTNSSEYVILGNNFAKESSEANLHPEIKSGDVISLNIDGVILKRKVLSIVESFDKQDSVTNIASSGIIISEKDYQEIKAKSNLRFPTIYGIKAKESIGSDELVKEFRLLFLDKNISSVAITSDIVEKNTRFLDNLINIGILSFTFGFFISILTLISSLKEGFLLDSRESETLENFGLTSLQINLIHKIKGLFLIFLSTNFGLVVSVFVANLFYKLALPDEKLDINNNELLAIYLIVNVFSVLAILFLLQNKSTRKNKLK